MRKLTAAIALALALSACGNSDIQIVPEGFELPRGVELTSVGEPLTLGQAGTWVADPVNGEPTVLVGEIESVTTGAIEDFFGFNLGESIKTSTPVYIGVSVRNGGPVSLIDYSLPLFADVNAAQLIPATAIKGPFNACQNRELPAEFASGSAATLCLVYLIPQGQSLTSLKLLINDTQSLSWSVQNT